MYWKVIASSLMVIPMTLNSLAGTSVDRVLGNFEAQAAKWNAVIALPQFETETNAVRESVRETIKAGNTRLDRIAAIEPGKATFQNTVRALDDLGYEISLTDNRLQAIKETSPNAALRDSATDALKELEEWMVAWITGRTFTR